jgi:pyridoxine 5-phosphate synthase
MLKLGVNIDHVATIRQARGGIEPDPVAAAALCELAGAHGITVHLREDRRHIQERDVRILKQTVQTKLNLEMADAPEMVRLACEIRPHDACLVPEKRQEITTEGGLDVVKNVRSLKKTVARLQDAGIRVSMFIDPVADQVKASADIGANAVELHTGRFANTFFAATRGEKKANVRAEVDALIAAAHLGRENGLQINAGHGLNYQNLPELLAVPHLSELNIGHSIVSRAVLVGLDRAVREMLALMAPYKNA